MGFIETRTGPCKSHDICATGIWHFLGTVGKAATFYRLFVFDLEVVGDVSLGFPATPSLIALHVLISGPIVYDHRWKHHFALFRPFIVSLCTYCTYLDVNAWGMFRRTLKGCRGSGVV